MSRLHPSIEIVGTYSKAVESVDVRCSTCRKEWSPKAYSLLQGKGCPHCNAMKGAKNNRGITGLKDEDAFAEQLLSVYDSIKTIGLYVNTHTDIQCECKICGYRWSAKPYSLLQEHGCPRCVKSGTSFMEQFIYQSFCNVLGEKEVISRDKKTIGMELDIVIAKYKLAIEPGNWYLHKRSVERDAEKRRLCNKNGVRLITIYDKYPAKEDAPFNHDCLVYSEDLNRSNHSIIRELINYLFKEVGLTIQFTEEEWLSIEQDAYKNSKAQTHKDFVTRLKIINPQITVIGKYTNANNRILVACNKCGFEWDAVPASLLSGDGCRKCGTKSAHQPFVKQQKLFVKQVHAANEDIEVIGVYSGRHKPVKARCKICGFEWEPRASSLLRGSNHKEWKTIHTNM